MSKNAVEYDQIAREVFAPIYPVIARKIKNKTGITDGVCIDIGSGGGYLGIEMARISNLYVYLLDKSQEALNVAEKNIVDFSLQRKMKTILADVHEIPMLDQSVDLIISRGSIIFWEDQAKALKEIYRILAPGGIAYIGGGFGKKELKEQIAEEMQRRNQEWLGGKIDKSCLDYVEVYAKALHLAGIPQYKIIKEEVGLWIIIRK